MRFDDLIVLETTTGTAGPYVGRHLADLGMRVIKIESTARPDNSRSRVPPPGATAESVKDVPNLHELNAGKSSISLNLKTDEGRGAFLALLAKADVYMENFAPGWLNRLGLSHQLMVEHNPRLIILTQSAYGEDGPLSQTRAYAHIMTALAGTESVVGYRDGRIVPQIAGAVGDLVAAHFGLASVLAALHARERTGRGAILDMSQTEASACIAGIAYAQFAIDGDVPRPMENTDPRLSPHGIYRTAGDDQWVALSVESDPEWLALCNELGVDPADRDLFGATADRVTNREHVDRIVATHLMATKRDDVAARLQSAGIACTPVLDCYEAEAHPEFVARGLWAEVPHPTVGTMKLTRTPWRLDGTSTVVERVFEPVGASTARVLSEVAGYDDERYAAAERGGAFA